MTSKQIFDHPELLQESTILSLNEATKKFPSSVSRATLERWIRRGVHGVKLATIKIGGRRFTTASAIQDFLLGQQHTTPEPARSEPRRGNLSKKSIADLSKKYRLPEPQ